jgi:hypothetical protein
LAASVIVGSNRSAGKVEKTIGPRVVHAKISNHAMQRFRAAIKEIRTLARMCMA